jgi:hypothetical protein
MQKLLYIFLGFLLVLAALAVYLIVRFQIWGLLAVLAILAGLFYLAYLLVGKSFKRLLMAPFVAKGAVLRKAKAQVHSIREARHQNVKDVRRARLEAEAEEGEDVEDEDVLPPHLRYFTLDVTIRPTFPAKSFTLWEPAELLLVPFHADDNKLDEDTENQGYVEHCEIYEDGKFVDRDVQKLEGRQRVRLLFSIPQGLRRVKFRYYFESFGQLELPEPGAEEEEEEDAARQNGSNAKAQALEDEARRRKKNKVKNTQRLNLSMLSEEARAEAGRSDDVSAPPWAAGKSDAEGPRDIVVPAQDEEDEPLVNPRDVKVTSRINIPPAPKADPGPGHSGPRPEEKETPPAPKTEAEPGEAAAPQENSGAEPQHTQSGAPAESPAPAAESSEPPPAAHKTPTAPAAPAGDPDPSPAASGKPEALREDFSVPSGKHQEKERTTPDGEKIVKPIKIDPVPLSAKSTAVKQSTLTQRLMELSREKGGKSEQDSASETQPWQKPKHPERLEEPEPPAREQTGGQPGGDATGEDAESAAGRKFYVAREGRPTGPYTLADLRRMLESGDLEEKEHAWTEGLPYWVTVSSILYNYR